MVKTGNTLETVKNNSEIKKTSIVLIFLFNKLKHLHQWISLKNFKIAST